MSPIFSVYLMWRLKQSNGRHSSTGDDSTESKVSSCCRDFLGSGQSCAECCYCAMGSYSLLNLISCRPTFQYQFKSTLEWPRNRRFTFEPRKTILSLKHWVQVSRGYGGSNRVGRFEGSKTQEYNTNIGFRSLVIRSRQNIQGF